LRCFEQIELTLGSKTTLICGGNGSGKTTLLEGLSLAGLGKSFISRKTQDIVKKGALGLSVKAIVEDDVLGESIIIVRKTKESTEILIDQQVCEKASFLAQKIPMIVVNSKAASLLKEGPSNRRALIDRTMFHVEPKYVTLWKGYSRALRQRNESLRNRRLGKFHGEWDELLVELGTKIDESRQDIVSEINKALSGDILKEVFGPLTLKYFPGWSKEKGYRAHLAKARERDKSLGYTSVGAHRADVAFHSPHGAIAHELSRGQAKFLVCGVLLSLADFITGKTAKNPVILVDDLAAELDDKLIRLAMEGFAKQKGQTVFTAIRPNELLRFSQDIEKVFHVEQQH
jgi:DNA replication and repair protein RecF